jgi:hypothetical protein
MCSRIAWHGSGGALEVGRVRQRKYHRLGDHGYSLLYWNEKPSKTLHVSDDPDVVFLYSLLLAKLQGS